jgi:hypothetical protein
MESLTQMTPSYKKVKQTIDNHRYRNPVSVQRELQEVRSEWRLNMMTIKIS